MRLLLQILGYFAQMPKYLNLESRIFSILTLKKGAKTGKSQRVLKALIVLIFEKFQLSASQNNLKFVVGASW